ncbi:MAG: DUF1015 domain-containing protein, partial [Deltaproteobacteria bacterium]|nr:DUF1015 domain-containing protein [Deltaproteobacteria bacterium]
MAEIMPFKGVLYNADKVGSLKKVMAPPYDVISPKMQDELYARHPNNIVRIILSKAAPDDAPGSDKYSRAASDLKDWVLNGVLVKDVHPSIYYYIQRYALKDGSKIKRKGFISLVRLAELGVGIHAHEQTLSGPKADRLRLMQACNANLSPIFSLYSDPRLYVNRLLDAAADKGRPVVDVEDDNGVENIIWRVDDADIIREVSALMAGKALFIADGHHRYETALNYRNLMREKNPHPTGLEPYNYVMMYFSNMDSEGMTIWPTHRVIHGLAGFDGDNLLKECARYFDMQEFRFAGADEPRAREAFLKGMEEAGRRTTAIGLHIRARNAYHVMTLKEKETGNLGAGIPEVFKSLDVT